MRRPLAVHTIWRCIGLALAAIAVASTDRTEALADPPSPPSYRQAVQDAYDLIRGAQPNDSAPARRALAVLDAGTGSSQIEISADLRLQPPDYDDARARLLALLNALDNPATTSDPALAQHRLNGVLAMHRYDALHRPPSPLDRLEQWIGDRINELLRLLFGGTGGSGPSWFFYLVGAAVLAVIAFVVFRSAGGRLTQLAVANQHPNGPRAPADYFAEADRLSARGDRVGAIRALCAGVAATLAGARTWEGSPLTVREIFQHAPDPERLHPLLMPFEAAVYGGREVDPVSYARAAQVAAPFRQATTVAAA